VIGELVMEALKSMDQVAYIRFASVYRDFKDAADFEEELRQLVRNAKADETAPIDKA
jgi:transcriptional repressor NrdR